MHEHITGKRAPLFVEGDPAATGGGTGEPARTPTFVPSDDFKTFQTTVLDGFNKFNESLKQVTESLQALSSSRVAGDPNAPTRVTEPPVTADQYEAAVTRLASGQAQEGDVKIMTTFPRQQAEALTAKIANLEASGAASISTLAEQGAPGRLKHFKRFDKEIKKQLDALPPAIRMLPQAVDYAYNTVVGQHVDELTTEAAEEAKRGQRDSPANANTPGGSASGRTVEGAPAAATSADVGKLFGEDAVTALASVGKDFESMVKKMGYKSAADYIAVAREQGVITG